MLDELTLDIEEQLARRDLEYAKLLQGEARERNMKIASDALAEIKRKREQLYLILAD